MFPTNIKIYTIQRTRRRTKEEEEEYYRKRLKLKTIKKLMEDTFFLF